MTPAARTIDLNADVGEDPVAAERGEEGALLALVTSANVACGGHAGDEATMRATIRASLALGVAIGAHPSYPDRARFGRAEMPLPPEAIEAAVAAQVAALGRLARELGATIRHVKPHGALYHAAMRRPEVARAVARGAASWSREAVLVGQAGAPGLALWRAEGFRAAAEAFADRRYAPDGALVPRGAAGALIEDPAAAAAQAVGIARGDGVATTDGSRLPVRADTICVHGDTPGAVAIARAVRAALEAAGIGVGALASAPARGGIG